MIFDRQTGDFLEDQTQELSILEVVQKSFSMGADTPSNSSEEVYYSIITSENPNDRQASPKNK